MCNFATFPTQSANSPSTNEHKLTLYVPSLSISLAMWKLTYPLSNTILSEYKYVLNQVTLSPSELFIPISNWDVFEFWKRLVVSIFILIIISSPTEKQSLEHPCESMNFISTRRIVPFPFLSETDPKAIFERSSCSAKYLSITLSILPW